jgi:PhzF family phenazine biosynthesis protein
MTQNVFQVDAFADAPFEGNPAAVVLLTSPADTTWCQSVAAEMNLSETAFVEPANADGLLPLRWFTPTTEVDLCGHATLATAHVIWETGQQETASPIRFATRSGCLEAHQVASQIALRLPRTKITPTEIPAQIARALSAEPVAAWSAGLDLLIEISGATALRRLEPNLGELVQLAQRGICVTTASDLKAFDFLSRFFAPAVGIAEDPVTGSSHTYLGPLWAERLGRHDVCGRQVSSRGGTVQVHVQADHVILAGGAVTVMAGTLRA